MPHGSASALMPDPVEKSVTAPAGVMRPNRLPETSTNQRLPSAPRAIPSGLLWATGSGNSVTWTASARPAGASSARKGRAAPIRRSRSERMESGFQERGDRGGAELNQITIPVWETARVGLDWGDGDYARTAALLAPAAEVLVDAAGVAPATASWTSPAAPATPR